MIFMIGSRERRYSAVECEIQSFKLTIFAVCGNLIQIWTREESKKSLAWSVRLRLCIISPQIRRNLFDLRRRLTKFNFPDLLVPRQLLLLNFLAPTTNFHRVYWLKNIFVGNHYLIISFRFFLSFSIHFAYFLLYPPFSLEIDFSSGWFRILEGHNYSKLAHKSDSSLARTINIASASMKMEF